MVRSTLRRFGVDFIRANHNPVETWLSLRNTPFKCIIDVGANEGQFAAVAARAFLEAELHCFEPQPGPFETLKKLAQRIGQNRVHCYPIGLADKPGELELETHLDHNSSSSFLKSTVAMKAFCPVANRTAITKATVSTLDIALPKESLCRSPVLLKLDVQGYEDRVLRGAVKSLASVNAAIVEVTFANFYSDQARFIDIATQLSQSGLEYVGNINQIYDRDGSVLWTDCVFTRTHGQSELE